MQSKDLKTKVMVSGESKTVENTGKLPCWFVVGAGRNSIQCNNN